MTKPTRDEVQDVLQDVEDDNLPDGAYWMMCHERLGLEYGDLFPLMEEYGMLRARQVTDTIILAGERQRHLAHMLIDNAPDGHVVTVKEPTRNLEQNARMWAMLGDISKAQPEGRKHTPETWKAIFMQALGYETRFEMALDGAPFPVGFRSSKLTVRQMAELITFIQAEADRRWQIEWSEPNPYERAET